MGVGRNFSRGLAISMLFVRTKFEIDGTGTNEGIEKKIRSPKSVNILMCFKFSDSFIAS